MKEPIVIKEYCKIVMPFFSGYGAALHEVTCEKNSPEPSFIEHSFGIDESMNQFIKLGSIDTANRMMLAKKQPKSNLDYTFVISSKKALHKKVIFKEVKTNDHEKRFRILWKSSFGQAKTAKYLWGWVNPVMFTTMSEKDGFHSQIQIAYPTEKLIFKVLFPFMYPLQINPTLIRVDKDGKEHQLKILKRTEISKMKFDFNFEHKTYFRMYSTVIHKPLLGQTYKVVWRIGYKNLSKYLSWIEANQ